MASITTIITPEDMRKLEHRAKRIGITPKEAFRVIATRGVEFFLALLVDATKPLHNLSFSA